MMTAAPATERSPLGSHVRQLTIAEVVQETRDAVSIVFRIPDDMVEAFKYWPGQYLTLRIPSDRTGSVARCYSICSSPHLDDDELVVTGLECVEQPHVLVDDVVEALRLLFLAEVRTDARLQ
jgi:3-ketosteroid 9alpha-monooxygenase subunit B